MDKKDLEAIKHALAIKDYCGDHVHCHECVFGTERNGSCDLAKNLAADWELPMVKTYKEDFLEKFPAVTFDAESVCRRYLYPDSDGHQDCDEDLACEFCWDKTYVEGGTK